MQDDGDSYYKDNLTLSVSTEEEDSSQSPNEGKEKEDESKGMLCQASLSEDSLETCLTLRHSNVSALKDAQQRQDCVGINVRVDQDKSKEREEMVCDIPKCKHCRLSVKTSVCDKGKEVCLPSDRFSSHITQIPLPSEVMDYRFSFSEGKIGTEIPQRGNETARASLNSGEPSLRTGLFVAYDNKSTFDGASWSTLSDDAAIRLPSIPEQCESGATYFTPCHMKEQEPSTQGSFSLASQVQKEDSVKENTSDHFLSDISIFSDTKSLTSTEKSISASILSLDKHIQVWEREFLEKDSPQTLRQAIDSFWEDQDDNSGFVSIKSGRSEKALTIVLTTEKEKYTICPTTIFDVIEANTLPIAWFWDKLCAWSTYHTSGE
jgi:hypothetical protein